MQLQHHPIPAQRREGAAAVKRYRIGKRVLPKPLRFWENPFQDSMDVATFLVQPDRQDNARNENYRAKDQNGVDNAHQNLAHAGDGGCGTSTAAGDVPIPVPAIPVPPSCLTYSGLWKQNTIPERLRAIIRGWNFSQPMVAKDSGQEESLLPQRVQDPVPGILVGTGKGVEMDAVGERRQGMGPVFRYFSYKFKYFIPRG